MTARIDVEDVLSKLNNVEKVELLAGTEKNHSSIHLTNMRQVSIGGIPKHSQSMESLQYGFPMAPTAYVVPSSSME